MNASPIKSGYLKLFTRLAIFAVLIYLMDFIVGSGMKKLYFAPKEGKFYDNTYAFDSTRADVLIVGSSKAAHNYVSQIIEDSLQLSTYNTGNEGAHFLHQYALLQSIFKRHTPKVIIWDYYMGLKEDPLTYLELSAILPYYENHDEIKPIVNMRSEFEKYKMISKIYPYNSTLIYNVNKLISVYKNAEKDKSVKGFVPLQGKWKDDITKIYKSGLVVPLDTNCINAYKSVISYCKTNNIKLVMVNSPLYRQFVKTPNYDVVAREIAEKENIPFLEYSADTTYRNNRQYFNDPRHLNSGGAIIFTNKLVEEIKKTI